MMAGMSLVERIGEMVRFDGWQNVVLGIGGAKDPSTYTTMTSRGWMNEQVLEALYAEDHFAARVVEALPKHGLRPGWDLSVPGDPATAADVRADYEVREGELGVREELAQGSVWGRLHGGALTMIGADDRRAVYLPLREDRIESVRFLHTFNRRRVQPYSYYEDIRHPRFNKPELYLVTPLAMRGRQSSMALPALEGLGVSSTQQFLVHESRCIVWPGQDTTDERKNMLGGWDDSVLERCWDPLRQLAEDYSAKSMMLSKVSQFVYKLKNLYSLFAAAARDTLQRRMELMEISRSRARGIVMDTEEDVIQLTQPVAGIAELLNSSILRLASAANMPVAVLMGQSIAQMGGSNDVDLEQWVTEVDGWRENMLRTRHERIARLILLAKDGPVGGVEPDTWAIKYRPLRMQKPKELAETRKIVAETDAIRITSAIATAEAIALVRHSPGADTDLILDENTLRENLRRREELAKQPPKDNAELGTVGARSAAAVEIVSKVATGQLSRESGKAFLMQIFRFPDDIAESMLGPEDFEAKPPPPKGGTPGPEPEPPGAGGAGAPQGLPGFNDGGDPATKKEPVPPARPE